MSEGGGGLCFLNQKCLSLGKMYCFFPNNKLCQSLNLPESNGKISTQIK